MNPAWHQANRLPRNATLEQRIAWHREHQRRCACRPIPKTLLAQMTLTPSSPPSAPDHALPRFEPLAARRTRRRGKPLG